MLPLTKCCHNINTITHNCSMQWLGSVVFDSHGHHVIFIYMISVHNCNECSNKFKNLSERQQLLMVATKGTKRQDKIKVMLTRQSTEFTSHLQVICLQSHKCDHMSIFTKRDYLHIHSNRACWEWLFCHMTTDVLLMCLNVFKRRPDILLIHTKTNRVFKSTQQAPQNRTNPATFN